MKIMMIMDVDIDGEDIGASEYADMIEECCRDQNLHVEIDKDALKVLEN